MTMINNSAYCKKNRIKLNTADYACKPKPTRVNIFTHKLAVIAEIFTPLI